MTQKPGMKMPSKGARFSKYLPIVEWGRNYRRKDLAGDLLAAVIVTIMLIPQSLAYAMLAGLPPEIGLYASILPLVAYALFGTSRTLAVGPVAVASLMTAAAAGSIAAQGTPEYIAAALMLALLSGLILLAMGLFRLGFLANFLSHPVISGFITASGLIIAASQLKHIFGISVSGHTLLEIVPQLGAHLSETNGPTLIIGASAIIFLFWSRSGLKRTLIGLRLSESTAAMFTRTAPVFAVAGGILAVQFLGLEAAGVRIVGEVPSGLPALAMPQLSPDLMTALIGSAALISLVGFVESVSVAQTLAAKRRQRVDPNQELIGLGTANLAAGFSGGYPVTGGFARSAVNFDAGAQTPAAGIFTAIGIALAALFLTPVLYALPIAVLGATIIVAVLSLVDLSAIKRAWIYSKRDFIAMMGTILITLTAGVELGIMVGVGLAILLHLYHTSRPHFAIVGQVPGTQHFRNVDRHDVQLSECVLTLRVDESLYFANSRFFEDLVYKEIADRPQITHLVLMCPAVNMIDESGLASLEAINARLKEAGVALHLSEVKGPVMDRLNRTDFLENLTGNVYLHQYQAMQDLDKDCAERAMNAALYSRARLASAPGD